MKFKVSHLSILAVLLTGISSNVNAVEQNKLDVFYYSLSDQYISSFKEQLDSVAKEQNLTLETYDANNDAGTQELQIASTLSNHQTKIINLVQPVITDEVIENCKKEDSRLVFFNRQPDLNILDGFAKAWYVEGDSMQAGQLQAEMVDNYIKKHPEVDRNKDGRISAILLTGPKDHQATYLRTTTVINELSGKYNNIDIKAKLNGEFDSFKARGELENFVIHNGVDQVELIICNNDAMALGALSVINNEGFNTGDKTKNYIPVFGIDAIEPALKAIEENKLEGTLVNDTKEQVKVILKLATSKETDNKKLEKELKLKISKNGTVYVPYTRVIKKN